MGLLAERSLQATATLPRARGHALILAAMASFYLSTPEARAPAAAPVADAVLEALGEPATLSMMVFRSRLKLRRMVPRAPGAPARRGGGAEVVIPTSAQDAAPAGTIALTVVPPAPLGHEARGIK
jgi:hypothetical protein